MRRSIAVRRYHSGVDTPTFPKLRSGASRVLGPALRRALRALGRGRVPRAAARVRRRGTRRPRSRAGARVRQRLGRALLRATAAGTCSASTSATQALAAARADARARRGRVRHARLLRARCPRRPSTSSTSAPSSARCRGALWPRWARRMAELVRPGGVLAGFFFFDARRARPALPAARAGRARRAARGRPSSAIEDAAGAPTRSTVFARQGALAGLAARFRSRRREQQRLRVGVAVLLGRRGSRCPAAPSRACARLLGGEHHLVARFEDARQHRHDADREPRQRPHLLAPSRERPGEVAALEDARRHLLGAARGKPLERALRARASSPRSASAPRSGCPATWPTKSTPGSHAASSRRATAWISASPLLEARAVVQPAHLVDLDEPGGERARWRGEQALEVLVDRHLPGQQRERVGVARGEHARVLQRAHHVRRCVPMPR